MGSIKGVSVCLAYWATGGNDSVIYWAMNASEMNKSRGSDT